MLLLYKTDMQRLVMTTVAEIAGLYQFTVAIARSFSAMFSLRNYILGLSISMDSLMKMYQTPKRWSGTFTQYFD